MGGILEAKVVDDTKEGYKVIRNKGNTLLGYTECVKQRNLGRRNKGRRGVGRRRP